MILTFVEILGHKLSIFKVAFSVICVIWMMVNNIKQNGKCESH